MGHLKTFFVPWGEGEGEGAGIYLNEPKPQGLSWRGNVEHNLYDLFILLSIGYNLQNHLSRKGGKCFSSLQMQIFITILFICIKGYKEWTHWWLCLPHVESLSCLHFWKSCKWKDYWQTLKIDILQLGLTSLSIRVALHGREWQSWWMNYLCWITCLHSSLPCTKW